MTPLLGAGPVTTLSPMARHVRAATRREAVVACVLFMPLPALAGVLLASGQVPEGLIVLSVGVVIAAVGARWLWKRRISTR